MRCYEKCGRPQHEFQEGAHPDSWLSEAVRGMAPHLKAHPASPCNCDRHLHRIHLPATSAQDATGIAWSGSGGGLRNRRDWQPQTSG